MGNQIQHEIINPKEYDLIFHIDKMNDVDIGWPIQFQNQELREMYQPEKAENDVSKIDHLKKNVKWDSHIVTIQGQNNRGKTFLLNLLGDLELPKHTQGLSVKLLRHNNRSLVFLDTAGINSNIIPLPFKVSNLEIEEKKGTEYFLRDLTVTSSDLNLVVVGDQFGEVDQVIMNKVAKTIVQKIKREREIKKSQKHKSPTKTRPEMMIIHNMKDQDYEQALSKWKVYLKEMSRYTDIKVIDENIHTINVNEKLDIEDEEDTEDDLNQRKVFDVVHRMDVVEDVDGVDVTVTHFFLCAHQGEDAKYNLLVAEEIKKWLTSGPEHREPVSMNPFGFLSTMTEMNITNYMTGTNKMGMYYLTDHFSLFYLYLHSPFFSADNFVNEQTCVKQNCEKFGLELEKGVGVSDFTSNCYSLMETKNILKWNVNQCEQLREWMLTNRDKKINGINFDFFPNLHNLKWDDYVENMWKRNVDFITLYAMSQVLKYRIVIITSSSSTPVFVFNPEKDNKTFSKETTLYYCIIRNQHTEPYYCKMVPNRDNTSSNVKKILEISNLESKIRKFSHIEVLTFRSNENSKEKKLLGGKSILKNHCVSSSLENYFEFSQQFSVKYTTEINKKDESLRLVLDVPDSSNDHLEYDCNLLHDPKRFKLEVKGRREQKEDWFVSEGTRKFGDWSFSYEIPRNYTLEQPEVDYVDGSLIFTFKHGEVQSTAKKIIKKKN